MTTIDQTTDPAIDVPIDVLEALLRDHLTDPSAMIRASRITPCVQQGTNDSISFFQATFSWASAKASTDPHITTWILKHWNAGGARDSGLEIVQPREVLAWERGWLRPDALPDGIVVPFTGAWRSPDNTESWLAMADVSDALSMYPPMSLPDGEVIRRTRAILEWLACFHALWEQPTRQAEVAACPWLRRLDSCLWEMAPTYTHALKRPLSPHVPPAVHTPPVWDGLHADLEAFFEARPASEQQLWIELMTDRKILVDGLADYPQTLLHNDLDDRNIGLHAASGALAEATLYALPDLVLIDWEWIGRGPAAHDVANVIQRAPVMLTPGTPIPEVIWTDSFANHYFASYTATGGDCGDALMWRRAVGLALIALGVYQMPVIHGSMRRALRGEISLPQIVGVPEAVVRQNLRAGLPIMERMEQRVINEAQKWL
jgi:hypothetical protein